MPFVSIGVINNSSGDGSSSSVDLTNVNRRISKNKNDINKLNDKVEDNQTNLNSINNNITKYNSDIEQLKADVLKNDVDIGNFRVVLNHKKDELVKMNSDDLISGYLEDKIDKNTIQVKDNKLVANTLEGLEVTISELNSLKGIKKNVQLMMDFQEKGMQFQGFVDTYDELIQISNPQGGYTAIVRKDIKNDNKKMFYIYGNKQWSPAFEVSQKNMGRDFVTQPINLMAETTGILPEIHIDETIARKTDVNEKVSKVKSPIEDNIVLLDKDGNIKDSKFNLEQFAPKIHTHEDLMRLIDSKENKGNVYNPSNKEILNKLSESVDGNLLYDGKLIEGNNSDIPSQIKKIIWSKFEL